MKRLRSNNFITTISNSPESVLILQELRFAFKKRGVAIKWYKNKDSYSVYFRCTSVRKAQVIVRPDNVISIPVVDLNKPLFDMIEANLTPEQVEVA